MVVYISLILFCTVFGQVIQKSAKGTLTRRVAVLLCFLLLFSVSAFRYDVGTDYSGTYTTAYQSVLSGDENIRLDFIVLAIYRMMALFKANLQWIFVILSFIMNYFACRSINEQSEYKALSYFIYICGTLYFFSMNGTRQAIAIAIFALSLKYLYRQNTNTLKVGEKESLYSKRNNRKAYRLRIGKKSIRNVPFFTYGRNIILAGLFHGAELIYLPIGLVIKHKISAPFKIISLIVLYGSNSLLIPYINNFLLGTKYAMYVYHWRYQETMEGLNFSMILNLLILAAYEFVLYRERKKNTIDKDIDIVFDNIHYIGALVSMFATSFPMTLRIFMDFRYLEYLSVPNLISHVDKKYKRIVFILAYTLYLAYFIWNVGLQNGNGVLPYQTIFSK